MMPCRWQGRTPRRQSGVGELSAEHMRINEIHLFYGADAGHERVRLACHW